MTPLDSENLGRMLSAFLVTAGITIGSILTSKLKDRKKRVPVDVLKFQEVDLRIHERLAKTGLAVRAIRVFVSKYKNGEEYVDGSETIKKSRTHEWVADGVAYQAESLQQILVSTMPDETELVKQPGPSYRKVTDLQPGKLKWLCITGGTRAIARVGILNRQGKLVGLFGVDFDDEEPRSTEELESICVTAGIIGELLYEKYF